MNSPVQIQRLFSLSTLTKNPMVFFGFSVIFGIGFLVLLGPWIHGSSPTELRPWIGAKPPGYKHPDCLIENIFILNQKAQTSPRLLKGKDIKILVKQQDSKTLRIALRKGKIAKITEVKGAIPLTEIDLRSQALRVEELRQDGTRGRSIPKVYLQIGDVPPSNLMTPNQRVLFFQVLEEEVNINYSISQELGIVNTIIKNDKEITQASILAENIVRISVDGEPTVQKHLLGTDDLGRDLFSRILFGGRISLLVGITATLVSLLIGVFYGALSGYIGGKTDRIMMGFIDILYAIPFMFLVIILLVLFSRSILILFVALGAVQWLTMARIIRGQILSLKEMEFIAAARVCGASTFKILFVHLIPNSISPMIIYATLTVPAVILEESFLSFLGLSVQFQGENLESWGSLIFQGMQSLGLDGSRSWLLIWPAATMALTLLGLNCLGEGLRDYFDPKRRRLI